MRELNAGCHKLRRPSFSNTLSELPEVEEPEYVCEETLRRSSEGTSSSFKVLPPINNEEIHPSPRPRFNTFPEGVTERPKSLDKTTLWTIDAKHVPMDVKERLVMHSYPGRTYHVQNLETRIICPDKTKKSKRKKMSDKTPRRTSFSSGENGKHDNSKRRRSSTVPPIQRCSEASVSPSSDRGSVDKNGSRESNTSNTSVDSTHKVENAFDTETSNKNLEVIRWRKALDRAKNESPCGSFENLAKSIMGDDYYNTGNRRRFSMPLESTWNRRMSNPAFADTSRKVDILLKYGKALRNKYHNIPTDNKSPPPKTIRTLADFMIEMPKKPRFSSFMSPEAQYSLMKGYEDKLYRKLSSSLPNQNPVLKRNKTPKNTSVDIKPKNSLGFLNDSADEDDDDDELIDNTGYENGLRKGTKSFITQIDDNSSNFQSSPPTVVTDSHSIDSEQQSPNNAKQVLRSLRRLSISLEKSGRASVNKQFHDGYDADDDEDDICSTFTPRQRSHSMPCVSSVPFQRRLMMSYRLQSAMDILDTIKCGEDTKLSPRLKVKRGANLAEYNTWVSEWNNEFCLKNCNG